MPKFLPVLRGGASARAQSIESKAVPIAFAQYYSDLSSMNLHRRARDWPIERAITEGYERVIWCFKAVNTIAADSARLPFRLREGIEVDAAVVEDHPLYRILNKRANPAETGQVFRKRLSSQILLSKRGAFVEYTKSNGGSIMRMDLLPPDRTEPIPDQTGAIDYFRLTRKDGSTRNLDPKTVRWFRDPHPTDPYMGVTPLESAGMSVELDHFARLYNVSFMQNDGRPGGVLAVRKTDGGTGDIDPVQMNRIEDRFGKGPIEAGKLSVIAGDLSYVDLAARPRDMQYGQTSRNAKIEILSAFGVSETVLGYAAERTFSNADSELYNYWTRTIPAHNDILLAGFDEDSDDDLNGYLDTSGVEVLDRMAKERRAEAREEFDKGLRSPRSYATLAGYEDEVADTPYSRALYIASGRTPLPGKEEDIVALGLSQPIDPNAPPPPEGEAEALPLEGDPDVPVELGVDPALAPPLPPGAPAPPAIEGPPSSAARDALAALTSGKSLNGGGGERPKVLTTGYSLSRKSSTDGTADRSSDPSLAAADALEAAVAAVLTDLSQRWCERAIARLGSPKQRKHTRHWTPEYDQDTRLGTKALDAAKAVDEQTWQEEAEKATHPVVTAAAVAAVVLLLTDLKVEPPRGVTLAVWAARLVTQTVLDVVTGIGRSALHQGEQLVAAVNHADQEAMPLPAIKQLIRERAESMKGWAQGVATQVATATTNGSRDDAAREANRMETGSEIIRLWVSRRDHKVRATHDRNGGADGQTRGLDAPFLVGNALLRYPGDPLGPLRETANCRCWLRHRMRRTGRWVPSPDVKALATTTTARPPRDGDGDGYVDDGLPTQRAALRAALPNEAAIARGARLVGHYRAEARGWTGDRFDLAHRDLAGEKQTVAAMFTVAFTDTTGRHVSTELDSLEARRHDGGHQFIVEGRFRDDDTGEHLGRFTRDLRVPPNGPPFVEHSNLGLLPPYQGHGVAAEFNAHALAWYKELGVSHIGIDAGATMYQGEADSLNGGYTWGEQGFDYTRPRAKGYANGVFASLGDGRLAIMTRFERAAFTPFIPEAWWADNLDWAISVLDGIDPADPPTPYELNQLGRDRPFVDVDTDKATWFGKALQSRSAWDGRFDLAWLDTYPEAKVLRIKRGHLLGGVMLAHIGATTDPNVAVLHTILDLHTETKSARDRDGDGDGLVGDGTIRERPVTPRVHARGRQNEQWQAGYDTTLERMRDEPASAREQAARDLDDMVRGLPVDSESFRTLTGARQAITDLHLDKHENVKPVYTEVVPEATPEPLSMTDSEFRDRLASFPDPGTESGETAYGECLRVSLDLVKHMGKGVYVQMAGMHTSHLNEPFGDAGALWDEDPAYTGGQHAIYMVQVGGEYLVVDYTARQFDKDAPYPLIVPWDEYKDRFLDHQGDIPDLEPPTPE